MKRRIWQIILLVVILSQILNILNSSVFTHTFSGRKINPTWGLILGYLRLPLVIMPIILFNVIDAKFKAAFYNFFRKNWDVILFMCSAWISMLINLTFDSVFYTVWHSASFYLLMIFLFFLRVKYLDASYLLLGKAFILSNIIVVPFLLLKISSVFSGDRVDMPFSHITFYPYCLLSVLIGLFIVLAYRNREQLLKDDFFRKRNLLFYIGAIIFIFVYMSASGRRTPFIAGGLVLIYFVYSLWGSTTVQKNLLRLLVVIATIGVATNFSTLINRYSSQSQTLQKLSILSVNQNFELEEGEYSESFAIRLQIWDSYLKIVTKQFLFGVGLNNGRKIHKATYPNVAYSGYSTHNTFIGVLVEQGVIGLTLFLVIFFRSLYLGLTENSTIRKFTLIIFFVIVVINWNEFNALSGQVFFWTTTIGILAPRIFLLRINRVA